MTEYTVSGEFETSGGLQQFTRTIEAPNESVARERVFSQFGSEHNVTRRRVTVTEITEADQ